MSMLKHIVLNYLCIFDKIESMNRIEFQGLSIKNYSLKDSLKQAKEFLNQTGVHLILCMSHQITEDDVNIQKQKEWLKNMNLCICEENDLLLSYRSLFHLKRNKNMKTDDFMMLYLRYLVAMKSTIMIVADSEDSLSNLHHYLVSEQEKLNIQKEYVFADTEERDKLFNEINDMVPDVIIAELPWKIQGEIMMDCQNMINTKVWLGLLQGNSLSVKRRKL